MKKTHTKQILAIVSSLTIALSAFLPAFPLQAAQADSTQAGISGSESLHAEESLSPQEPSPAPGQEEASSSLPAITSIEPLSEEEANFSFAQKLSLTEVTAEFPATLSVHMDGGDVSVPLPVTWKCDEDYENTDSDVYEFIPVWDTKAYPVSEQLKSWDIPSIFVSIRQNLPDYFLTDAEEAGRRLTALAKSKNILALVYLCDSYAVKSAPGETETTIVSLPTGQSVLITGVGEDSAHNIWYQVLINSNNTDYTGYIERRYLAYSDEDFLKWEDESITENPEHATRPARMSARNYIPEDIKAFPASYQSALMELKAQRPNWIFVNMQTDIDWNLAVKQENSQDRSLISSRVNASWKTTAYDSSWSRPSDGILSYYMDPRNFLTENYIFQFELLSYNPTYHTESAVQDMLKNTFMDGSIPDDGQGRTYAQVFYSIAQNLVVSPFHLASRVRQEQGDGKSALISGVYPGYTGLYNYFNIGATGKGNTQIIENGLAKAREYGWTTRFLSLSGGADMISKNYIRKGQDTLYLQKFNVNKNSSFGPYNHQYMQNIAAPSSESISVKKAYASAGSIDNPFVFRIPVYQNMPAEPCMQPANLKSVTLHTEQLTLKTDETAVLTASIDGKTADSSSVSFTSSAPGIATVAADGTVTAISSGVAEIRCTTSGGTTAVCTVTIQKNTPAYTTPVLNPVAYNPQQTLQAIALPAGWTWENPTLIPTVENSGYPAVYTPSDTGKYLTVRQTLSLTVTKGLPAYTIPSSLQTVTGNTLATLKLPAGFTWDDPSAALTKAGTFSYTVSYNPDPANYQTVTGISVSVTVTAKTTACTAHNYGEWLVTVPASCTTGGTQTRTCHQCGAKESASIPAPGHNYTSVVTRQATESQTGIRTYTCDRCRDTYTEEIAMLPATHKHSYASSVAKQPTCTDKGVTSYLCSCGDTYSEDIPALGHDMADNVCRRCGYTLQPVNTGDGTNHAGADNSNPDDGGSNDSSSDNGNSDDGSSDEDNSGDDNSNHDNAYTPATVSNADNGTADSPADNTPAGQTANPRSAPAAQTNTGNAANSGNAGAPSGSAGKSDSPDNNPVVINMQHTTVLYEETISSLRGRDIDVTLDMGNDIHWTINGTNIVTDEANGIDMGIQTNAGNVPASILEQAARLGEIGTVIELNLSHDGSFDFLPTLTLHTDSGYAGYHATLFYHNPEAARLEYIAETTVTENGDIHFLFSHASDYVVIIGNDSLAAIGAITADGIENANGNATQEDGDILAVSAEPAQEPAVQELEGFHPPLLLIILLPALILIAIGCTAYLIFRSKNGEDEREYFDEDEPLDDDSEDDDYYEPES